MKQINKFKIWSVVMFSLALGACSSENDMTSQTEKTTEASFQIKLSAQSASATRGENHDTVPGDRVENYLAVSENDGEDYEFYLFDEDGNFIQTIQPTKVSVNQEETGTTATFTFEGKLPEDITKVQVLSLVNINHFNNKGYPVINNMTNLNDIMSQGIGSVFTYPDNNGETWMPSEEESKFIPMFGLSGIIDINDDSLIEIPLLRALAKIVVEDMEIKNITEKPKFTLDSIALNPYSKNGLYIPNVFNNDKWDDAEKQVVYPSLPSQVLYQTGENLKLKSLDWLNEDGSTEKVWIAYVPEMDFSKTPADLIINTTLNEVPTTSKIQITQYDDYGIPGSQGQISLLRNHIYHYRLKLKEGQIAEVEYTVCKWEKAPEVVFPSFE